MNFKVFGLHEKIYKFLVYGIVIISTISCIYYYIKTVNKSDTFIISIVYALLLFIVGIYITTMQNKVQNSFYRRKDQYHVMKKLNALFLTTDTNSCSDDDLRSFIIFHKGFTGRTHDGYKDKENPIYIDPDCFNYKNSFIILENKFIENQSVILHILNVKTNEYIDGNHLNKKVPYILISKVIEFLEDTSGWCEKNLELTTLQLEDFIEYIDKILEGSNKIIKEFKITISNLNKKHLKYSKKIKSIINKIENIYGERLFNEINKNDTIAHKFGVLEDLIKEVDRNMATYESHNELHEELEGVFNSTQEIKLKIDELSAMIELYTVK